MKKLITCFLAALMLVSVVMSGCGSGFIMEEGVHYSKQFIEDNVDETTGHEIEEVYNKDVFYRNDIIVTTADPHTFRCEDVTDTENYGKYFLYGTTGMGVFNCYMSEDLVSWMPKNGAYAWDPNGWHSTTCWAPEVIWDKYANETDYGLEDDPSSTGVYFIFCSSNIWQTYGTYTYNRVLDLAVSTSPYGPFKQWTGVETGAVINGVNYAEEENYATRTTYASDYAEGIYDGYVGREGDVVTVDDPWFNSVAAQASLSFQWENRANAGTTVGGTYVNEAAGYMIVDEGAGWFNCIDPHPYLDYNEMVEVDGVMQPKKYLFFTREGSELYSLVQDGKRVFAGTCVYAVEFINNDWSQIDYNSLRRITSTRYSFVSQAAADAYVQDASEFDATAFAKGYQEVDASGNILNEAGEYNFTEAVVESHILSNNGINEGAQLYYNEETGLYYLMISIANYGDNSYSLMLLTAYNVMGPYRKLTIEEGGLFLSTDSGKAMDNITGPGHHTLLECGDELLVIYHKHKDLKVSGSNRGYCVDRVLWVTNSNGMTIMHANGPTSFIQPKIYGTGKTEYDIISDEAEVSVKGKKYNDVKYLTDGIIPIQSDDVHTHVHEFISTDDKVVITLTFEDYRVVKSIMVYNSKDYDNSFIEVKEIRMDILKDGEEGRATIENLQFYWDYATFLTDSAKIRPGASAVADFNELMVKEIRITIENPNIGYSDKVAIPEIYVLGRPNA